MTLPTKIAKKLKSIHVLTKLSISAYDSKGKLLKEYVSNNKGFNPPNISLEILKEKPVFFDYGEFHELFFIFSLDNFYILIGPILTQKLDLSDHHSPSQKMVDYINQLPTISSSNLKEILILIDSVFNLQLEEQYFKYLKKLMYEQMQEFQVKHCITSKETTQSYCYAYHYEQRLLSLIATGDLHRVRQKSAQIGANMLPTPTKNTLRGEKNYSIMLMEKLSAFTIQLGLNIELSLKLRDYYINLIEEQKTIIKVLTIRDSAILHYTEAVHDIRNNQYSLLIRQIIQYICLHIFDSITLFDIEKNFFISNASLRRRFKSEVGISIGKYIQKQKIIEAKLLLLQQLPPSVVSDNLNFHDQAHFVRIFKKNTGLTPLQFQNQEKIKSDFTDICV